MTLARPITLFTGQWADLPFEEVARLAGEWGYDGLEIACWGDHLDPWRWDEPGYVEGKLALLEKYNLKVYAISNSGVYNQVGSQAQIFGEPRMYGMRLRYNFGN